MINPFKVLIPLGLFLVTSIVGLYLWQMENSTSLNSNLVSFATDDGVTIVGEFLRPSSRRAPVVLLVHQVGRDHTAWGNFPKYLSRRGIGVLAIDLRGHGGSTNESGRSISYLDFTDQDWSNISLDFEASLDYLKGQGISLSRISIVGASIGANEALIVSSSEKGLRSVVLLSPGEDYHGIRPDGAASAYGSRPALVISSSDDEQSYQSSQRIVKLIGPTAKFIGLSKAGHAMDMLSADPNLEPQIADFLLTR